MRFCTEKFKSFLLAGTFSTFVGYLTRITDSVIVGHVIGEDALAGVNMVTPLVTVVMFVSYAVALGTATNYSIWMGRLDRRRACGFFTQGLLLALLLGGAMALAMQFGEDRYFAILDGSEYVEMYGRQYLDWVWPIGGTHAVMTFLLLMCCADGDIRLCSIACGAVFGANVAVSFVAVEKGMGASGCALGDLVAEGVGILLLCSHFFRKVNTTALVLRFSPEDLYRTFRASFGDAAILLCDAILFFGLNKLVIACFGSDVLPVAGVAIVLWSFLRIFDGVGVAVQPLVTVYWGERNVRGVRKVMQAAMIAAAVEGLLASVVLVAWPQLAIWVVGVEYPELVSAARTCVMLMCIGVLPAAIVELFNSYFLYIERPWISLEMTVLCHLALPLAGMIAGAQIGLNGVWIGLGVGLLSGVLLMALAILIRRGRHGFPFLLPLRRAEKIRMFDLVLTEEEIVRISKEVAAALPAAVAARAALLVEEVFMTVRERNPRRKRLLGEVTLDFNDGIVMTLRDDGIVFDVTDSDAKVSSIRSYLVASVMRHQLGRLNFVTSGFNRNIFRLA